MPSGRRVVVSRSCWGDVARYAMAITLCALTAHAVAYGSLVPGDGTHGYFTWYAPLIGAASLAAFLGTMLALGLALVRGPASTAASALESVLPQSAGDAFPVGLFRLASAALVFLAVQESLERSLASGQVALVSFAPSTLAVLVAVVVLTAGAIVLVARLVSSLAEGVLRGRRAARVRSTLTRWQPGAVTRRALRPLAIHGGLRAPPLLS